jgi:hypothetical protein
MMQRVGVELREHGLESRIMVSLGMDIVGTSPRGRIWLSFGYKIEDLGTVPLFALIVFSFFDRVVSE